MSVLWDDSHDGLFPRRWACFPVLVHPSVPATLTAFFLLVSASVRADAPVEPEISPCAGLRSGVGGASALEACLGALAGAPTEDPGVRGSLEQAKVALARAAELRAEGELVAARRALRIARAALLLADRRLALARARATS